MIETQKYIRKPLYVDAVRVTNANFEEIAAWCQGTIEQDDVSGKGASKQYITVRVHNPKNPRQTKAFVGDWLLYTERGYKVYTNKAFLLSFDLVEATSGSTEIATTPPPVGQTFTTSSTEVTEPVEEETVEPPVTETRQVISEEDQQAMDPDELRELLKSGDFVLAQDLAA